MVASKSPVEWTIQNKGTFASVVAEIPKGSSIHTESDAIVTMSGGLVLQGEIKGGFIAALLRILFTQETFFQTSVKAVSAKGDCMVAANEPGDIFLHELDGIQELLLTRGSYVAADSTVAISTKVQKHVSNAKLSGTGLFLIRAHGKGKLACSAFGAIHAYTLLQGDYRAVDNGHLIAWTASMKYKIGKATSSLVGTFTSGEGIMCHFEGPGTVYVQSHTPKVELLAKAASPRKRKGFKLLAGVATVVLAIAVLNLYFFIEKWKKSLKESSSEEL